MAWWPRQTPSRGLSAATAARTVGIDTPASAGVPGPGEQQHAVVLGDAVGDLVRGEGVVPHHVGVGAELLDVAVEGVHEAVVVVDDEDLGHGPFTVLVGM